MSTILDALRRLESDRRRRDATEQARTSLLGPQPERGSRIRRATPWLIGAAVCVVVAAISAVYFVGQRPEGGDATAAAPAPVAAAAAPPAAAGRAASSVAPQIANAGEPSMPAAAPPAERQTIRREARPARARAKARARSAPAPSPVAESGTAPAVRPIDDLPSVPVASVPAPTPAPVRPESRPIVAAATAPTEPIAARSVATDPEEPTVARSATPVSEPLAASPEPAARVASEDVEDRSAGVLVSRDRSADVSIIKTIWHPSPDRRTAILRFTDDAENREVHEGDFVGGYEVGEIKLGGVVFVREGITVEKRVGPRPTP